VSSAGKVIASLLVLNSFYIFCEKLKGRIVRFAYRG